MINRLGSHRNPDTLAQQEDGAHRHRQARFWISRATVFGSEGLLDDIKKALAERMLSGCQAFSSFLNSLRNRQSVPRAMILCGLALIIPTSRRRKQ